MESINDPNLVVLGIAIPGETVEQINTFKENYGITFDIWMDVNSNYTDIIPPGGKSFPIDIVVDKEGIVTYLANDYYPGEAVSAAQDALAK